MSETKVRLEIEDVTQGISGKHPFFLILREVDGAHRKLSVMVGPFEAQAILVVMRRVYVPRPLLADVCVDSWHSLNIILREVLIYKVVDGVFYARLILEQYGQTIQVEARTSDAVALALRCQVPIYTYESLIAREHILDDGHGTISIPVSSVEIEVLREALSRAVREENYELAAQLRDEISRREKRTS